MFLLFQNPKTRCFLTRLLSLLDKDAHNCPKNSVDSWRILSVKHKHDCSAFKKRENTLCDISVTHLNLKTHSTIVWFLSLCLYYWKKIQRNYKVNWISYDGHFVNIQTISTDEVSCIFCQWKTSQTTYPAYHVITSEIDVNMTKKNSLCTSK